MSEQSDNIHANLIEVETMDVPANHSLLLTTIYDKSQLDLDSLSDKDKEESFLRKYNQVVMERGLSYSGEFQASETELGLPGVKMEVFLGENVGEEKIRFGCLSYQVGNRYAIQALTDREGVKKILEKVMSKGYVKYVKSSKVKAVENPELFHIFDYLAAFSKDMPHFGKVGVQLVGESHGKYALVAEIMKQHFDKMYNEHGLIVAVSIEPEVLKRYENPVFTSYAPFTMCKTLVERDLASEFSNQAFRSMVEWSFASGIWWQSAALTNPGRNPED